MPCCISTKQNKSCCDDVMRGLEISVCNFRLGNKSIGCQQLIYRNNYFRNVGCERFRFGAMGGGTRRVDVGGAAVAPSIERGHAKHRRPKAPNLVSAESPTPKSSQKL